MSPLLAVDFDGVLCNSKFPAANSQNWLNKSLLWYVKRKQSKGWLITLWTCRENDGHPNFKDSRKFALSFLWEHDFVPDFVNENDPVRTAMFGSDSRKLGADRFIDDRNVGLLGAFLRFVDKRSKIKNA